MSHRFASQPQPPYYAVVFTSQRVHGGREDYGYGAMARKMDKLATQQKGYIGHESARDDEGFGITVSYWMDEASLLAWKELAAHALAQKMGREKWYEYYTLRVAIVERQYDGPRGR